MATSIDIHSNNRDTRPSTYNTIPVKVNSSLFYNEYHGHLVPHLKCIYPPLRSSTDGIIWTAGDSSLDNKYWFFESAPAVGSYADVLDPPRSKCDVTYWLNKLAEERSLVHTNKDEENKKKKVKWGTMNTAIEATTLNQRTFRLLAQDKFLRDNIQTNDVLVVSIGGNDIALAPSPCTIVSMAGLITLPYHCIDNGCTTCPVPCNDYFCGGCSSIFSCIGAFPPCLGYFRHLFGVRVQKYIEKLTSKTKPKKILVCMIYYLDENLEPSWAGPALGLLGYNRNPEKLQMIIRKIFMEATSNIQIPGCEVIPVPLFNVLNGKHSEDYVARVEPSAVGGKKMADFLLDIIERPATVGIDIANEMQAPMSVSLRR